MDIYICINNQNDCSDGKNQPFFPELKVVVISTINECPAGHSFTYCIAYHAGYGWKWAQYISAAQLYYSIKLNFHSLYYVSHQNLLK